MADLRENLVELLRKTEINVVDGHSVLAETCFVPSVFTKMAEQLIAGGVTAPRWISVTERLPEEKDYYLCCVKSFLFPGRTYVNILKCDKEGFMEGRIYTDDVTHWMPLPEPPKEGCEDET